MVMSTDELELRELTRVEKVLALGLTVFLLLGGMWVLHRIPRAVPAPSHQLLHEQLAQIRAGSGLGAEEATLSRLHQEVHEAEMRASQKSAEHVFRREEYRTALDAGRDDPVLRAAYQRALADFEAAQATAATAQRAALAQSELTEGLRRQVALQEKPLWEQFERQQRRYDLLVFCLRMLYVGPVLALSIWAWARMRMARSQYLLIGTSLVGFGILQAVFLVGSYAWTIFRQVAQLAVSIGGSAITIVGIVALRRYLANPARLRRARSRRGRCPRCDYPVQPEAAYCADCGERVAIPCGSCQRLRPAALAVCPHCGARS